MDAFGRETIHIACRFETNVAEICFIVPGVTNTNADVRPICCSKNPLVYWPLKG